MIVLVGAACSGKNTIADELLSRPEAKNISLAIEHTTRPKRENETNEYVFVTPKEHYINYLNGVYASAFEVLSANGDIWKYSILLEDVKKQNTLCITNPTSLRQIKHREYLLTFYLNVSQRERLIRMLKRGDNISEAYRRSCHDEGHFSGITNEVDYTINAERTPEEIVDEIVTILESRERW